MENGAADFVQGGGLVNAGGSLENGAADFVSPGGFTNDGGSLEDGSAGFVVGQVLTNDGGSLEDGSAGFVVGQVLTNDGGSLEDGAAGFVSAQTLTNAGGSFENGAAALHRNLPPLYVATVLDPSTCAFGGRILSATVGTGTQAGSTSSTTFATVAQWVQGSAMNAGDFFASLNITALSANAEIRFYVKGANGTTCAIPDASTISATYNTTGIFQEFLTMAHTAGVNTLIFILEMRRASGAGSVSVTITRGTSSLVRAAG